MENKKINNYRMDKRAFNTEVPGVKYSLPKWKLEEQGLSLTGDSIGITFVKGVVKEKPIEEEYNKSKAYLDSISVKTEEGRRIDIGSMGEEEIAKITKAYNTIRAYEDQPEEGLTHEGLLSMVMEDLVTKNRSNPSFELTQVIVNISQAINWLNEMGYMEVKRRMASIGKKQ